MLGCGRRSAFPTIGKNGGKGSNLSGEVTGHLCKLLWRHKTYLKILLKFLTTKRSCFIELGKNKRSESNFSQSCRVEKMELELSAGAPPGLEESNSIAGSA